MAAVEALLLPHAHLLCTSIPVKGVNACVFDLPKANSDFVEVCAAIASYDGSFATEGLFPNFVGNVKPRMHCNSEV